MKSLLQVIMHVMVGQDIRSNVTARAHHTSMLVHPSVEQIVAAPVHLPEPHSMAIASQHPKGLAQHTCCMHMRHRPAPVLNINLHGRHAWMKD